MNFNFTKNCDDFSYIAEKNNLIYQMRLSLALRQRKIFLYDMIDENSITETMYYLHRLMEADSISGEKKPIEILINSNGGYCYDGLSLISLIESMIDNGYNIITTNMGRAFSMGFMIAISGSERRSYRYSRYMFHDVSSGTYGKLELMEKDLEETKILRDMIYEITCKKTSLTKEQMADWQHHHIDKYFSSEEALEFHITDKIV